MYLIYLPLLATLGPLILGYDIGMIGTALLYLKPAFALDNLASGFFASILIPGIITGNITTSLFADQFKRTTYMTLAAVLFLLGYALMIITPLVSLLYLGRLLCGMAVGIVLVIVPLYLVEMAPENKRGQFMAFFQLSITFGILLGYLISYILNDYQTYHVLFLGGFILAVCLLIASYYLPVTIPFQTESANEFSFKLLFKSKYVKPLLIANTLAILQQFTGINAIIFYAPQIMQRVLHLPADSTILPGVIMMGFNFIFTIIAVFSLDQFGRRPILMLSFLIQAIAMSLLALLSVSASGNDFAYIAALVLYIAGFAIGLGPLMWLIAAEIYPPPIRTVAMSITVIINNIATFLITFLFLSMLSDWPQATAFWLFALMSMFGMLFILRILPETKAYPVV